MPEIITPTVSVYPFRRSEQGPEYLALRRADVDHLSGTWQLVHGGIDPGETAVQAAWREIQEEIGLTPLRFWQLDHVETHYLPPKDAIRLVPCFVVELSNDAEPTLGPEHDDHAWLGLKDLRERLIWRSQQEAVQVADETIVQPLMDDRPINPLLELDPPAG